MRKLFSDLISKPAPPAPPQPKPPQIKKRRGGISIKTPEQIE
ncbi:type I methionyl aminopeptidase, partial [Arthrospira platensis PCC 7345]